MSSCRSSTKSVRCKTSQPHSQDVTPVTPLSKGSLGCHAVSNVTTPSTPSYQPLSVKIDGAVGEPFFYTRVPQNPRNKERSPFQGVDIVKTDHRFMFPYHYGAHHGIGQHIPHFDSGLSYWNFHSTPRFPLQMHGNHSTQFEGYPNQTIHSSQNTSSFLRSQEQHNAIISHTSDVCDKGMTKPTESSLSYVFPQSHHVWHPMSLWNPYMPLQPMVYPLAGHSSVDFYHNNQAFLSQGSTVSSSKNSEVQNDTSFRQQQASCQEKQHQLMPKHHRDYHTDCKSCIRPVFHEKARRCYSDSAFVSMPSSSCHGRDTSSDCLSLSSFSPTHSLSPPLTPKGNQRSNLSGQLESTAGSCLVKTNDQEMTLDKKKKKTTRVFTTNDRTSFSSSSLTSLSSLTSSSQDDSSCLASLDTTDQSVLSLSQDFKKKASVSSEGHENAGNEMNSFVPRVSKSKRRRKRSSNTDKKLVLDSDLFDPFYSLLLLHSLSHHLLRSFLDDFGKHFD